jgi:hypothetical protein
LLQQTDASQDVLRSYFGVGAGAGAQGPAGGGSGGGAAGNGCIMAPDVSIRRRVGIFLHGGRAHALDEGAELATVLSPALGTTMLSGTTAERETEFKSGVAYAGRLTVVTDTTPLNTASMSITELRGKQDVRSARLGNPTATSGISLKSKLLRST